MTMDFNVAEGVDLAAVKVGSRIRFTLVPGEQGAYRIDSVQAME
jgi:hypothetical protein